MQWLGNVFEIGSLGHDRFFLDGQGKHETAGGCLRRPGRGLILKIPKPETGQLVGFTARGNYRKDVALTLARPAAEFRAKPALFTGTDNPRHLRVIQAAMTRPLPHEQLDQIAGSSNGPDLVAELRRRGLEMPCTRAKRIDRDLFDCWPGVYHFTQQDRRRVNLWLTRRGGPT